MSSKQQGKQSRLTTTQQINTLSTFLHQKVTSNPLRYTLIWMFYRTVSVLEVLRKGMRWWRMRRVIRIDQLLINWLTVLRKVRCNRWRRHWGRWLRVSLYNQVDRPVSWPLIKLNRFWQHHPMICLTFMNWKNCSFRVGVPQRSFPRTQTCSKPSSITCPNNHFLVSTE